MSEPFLSEIKIFGFNFNPRGWAKCDGQLLPINQNQSLYSLLGTMYGGDGRTTFGLPELRGRTPMHFGDGVTQGQKAGAENHTVIEGEMPAHTHAFNAASAAATLQRNAPPDGGGVLASANFHLYRSGTGDTTITGMTSVGGSQSHDNMQPYQALNFCIALQGLFPSRN